MIELPRAALRADEIAEVADFFSFGTNDLTQTTLGMSRDDAEGKFLTFYLEDGVLERNPFEVLDQDGVGELMRIGSSGAAETKPEHQARDLRRARRRAVVGRVLPPDRARLRELLPVPRAARAPRRGAGRAEGSEARRVRPGRRVTTGAAAAYNGGMKAALVTVLALVTAASVACGGSHAHNVKGAPPPAGPAELRKLARLALGAASGAGTRIRPTASSCLDEADRGARRRRSGRRLEPTGLLGAAPRALRRQPGAARREGPHRDDPHLDDRPGTGESLTVGSETGCRS